MVETLHLKNTSNTAIVTGGAKGIGAEIVRKLSYEGYNVVLVDIDEEEMRTIVSNAQKDGKPEVLGIKADISDEESVKNMIDQAICYFGEISILINCAAIQTIVSFDQLEFKEWKRILDVNLNGTFLCCKYIAEHFKKNQKGNIINMTSIHATLPRIDKFHYDASKAAVSIFTKELALEMAGHGIRVNGIAPGAIETPMNSELLVNQDKFEAVISKIPMKRMGKPEDIADLVMFLISEKSKYITGEIITIDGGRSLT